MNAPRRLGRGLEALLSQPFGTEQPSPEQLPHDVYNQQPEGFVEQPTQSFDQPAATPPATFTANGITYVNVYEIDTNPFQPRREFDESEIEALAQSVRDHGILQPLVVRRVFDRYQLIAGERRLRAAIKAGWAQVPTQVREADDRQMTELAIVENLQRRDLNALEKATSFQNYLQTYGGTQEELAARLSIDRSTVANLIRLLELPEPVQHALRSGAISAGHARALLPLGDEREQVAFCERIQSEGLSVRVTESLVQDTVRRADGEPLHVVDTDGNSHPAARTRGDNLASLEQELQMALGTKVQLSQGAKGRGKITIHFTNPAEFDRLRAHLTHGQHGHQQPAVA